MDSELTIQQVAQRTGLSVHTLRYYERIGLLDGISRDASGHRRYAERDLEWISLLMRLRDTNMPIAEMQAFAQLVRQGEQTIPQRLDILESHQQMLYKQIEAIQMTLAALDAKIAHYRRWKEENLSNQVVVR